MINRAEDTGRTAPSLKSNHDAGGNTRDIGIEDGPTLAANRFKLCVKPVDLTRSASRRVIPKSTPLPQHAQTNCWKLRAAGPDDGLSRQEMCKRCHPVHPERGLGPNRNVYTFGARVEARKVRGPPDVVRNLKVAAAFYPRRPFREVPEKSWLTNQ